MSTTRGQLRRDIGSQIGDVLVATATATGASTSNVIDSVTFVHGDNILRGREAICVSASNGANEGSIHTVTGNTASTTSIDVRPAFSSALVAGDVIELYNADNGGPLIAEYHRAINRAIRDAAKNALVEITDDAAAFDSAAPTITIDSDWYGFIGAEWQDADDGDTWRPAPWRLLDPANRTVVVGQRGTTWLDGKQVRLRGCTVPAELTSESSATDLEPAWVVARACYHVLLASASRRTATASSTALALAQFYKSEAKELEGLVRTRLGPFHRLGPA